MSHRTNPPPPTARQREQDRATIRVAQALDHEAEDLLRAVPALAEALDTLRAQVHHGARTRGPWQLALRTLARAEARRHPNAARAHRHHQHADQLYWSVVVAWAATIRHHARRLGRRWRADCDVQEVIARLRVSWYEAALRYDPDADVPYDYWARRCQWARYAEGGPPDTLVRRPRNAYHVPVSFVPLDLPAMVDEREPADDAVGRSRTVERVVRCCVALTERQRHVLLGRHWTDEEVTLATLGREMNVSRERVRQLEQEAVLRVRTAWEATYAGRS